MGETDLMKMLMRSQGVSGEAVVTKNAKEM